MGYTISVPCFHGRVLEPFYEGPMLFNPVPVKIAVKFKPAKFKRSFVWGLLEKGMILVLYFLWLCVSVAFIEHECPVIIIYEPNYLFFIGNQLLFDTFGSRINPRAKGLPRWPSFGHFQPCCGPRWSWLGPNYPSFNGNNIILNIFGSRINPRARRCPRWPRFGHFRPRCGPRWSGLGPYYPFFIGNQLIFNTFGSKINPRDRGCPPWPSFGPFPASMRSKGVEVGLKIYFIHLESIPI